MKNLIKQLLRENLKNNNIVRLYHRIGNKKNIYGPDLIKSIFQHGLILHDNKEVGDVIWFSSNYDDYAKNNDFVVAYDYDKSKGYEGNNGITNTWDGAFGHEPIPFNDLILIKVPVMYIDKYVQTNEALIKLINTHNWTPEKFNSIKKDNVIIYQDLFNMYVQPKIDYPNFLNGIDQTEIKLINVL